MIKIYHNNRCAKSRCALQVLEHSGQPYELVEYLKSPPSASELKEILTLLGKKPLDIVRQKEPVFQENFKGRTFTDDEWISILTEHPVLIERPIVVSGRQAWIARDEASLDAISALAKS